MKRMFFRKEYKYYIAYCFNLKNGKHGFGNLVITNDSKMLFNTVSDIIELENFIKEKSIELKGHEVRDIVITEFRELKG